MRARLAAAAAALGALACAAGAAPPSHAARGMEVAVQDDPVFVDGAYYNRNRALAQARALGVTRLRMNVSWWETTGPASVSTRVPARQSWDWRKIDSAIDAAARYGIRAQLTLTGPGPAYANSDHRVGHFGPSPDLYAEWAAAAARHFKGRVDRYALWNEPNHSGWMTPLDLAPALYRELYVEGYAAIKRVDPHAQVLLGELVPYKTERALAPLRFLRDMMCARQLRPATLRRPPRLRGGPCPGVRTDGLAMHPYDYQRSPTQPYPSRDSASLGSTGYLVGTLRSLARIRALRTPRGGTVPIYETEFGYFNSGHYKIPQNRRSKYLVRAYRIAERNPFIKQMLQYSFITPPFGFIGGYFDLSLITRRGKELPPYRALRSWTRSAARSGRIARNPGRINLPPPPPAS